ncbi:uncharacterized protein [Diadema setosum]|uniref:uncharacterized protein n=1 Tax=Diadema setosum TaxID=31175 RepID=UPI003B3A9C3E
MRVYLLSWALFVALLGTCRGEVGDGTIDIDSSPDSMPAAVLGNPDMPAEEGSGTEPNNAGLTTDDEDLNGPEEMGSGTTAGNNEINNPAVLLTTISSDVTYSNVIPGDRNAQPDDNLSNNVNPVYDPANPANINGALEDPDKPDQEPKNFMELVFGNPAILAGMVGAVVLILLTVVLLFLFVIYRIKKKDEGSYSLDEPHKAKDPTAYWKDTKEFYA